MRTIILPVALAASLLGGCGNLRHTNVSLNSQDPLPLFTLRPSSEPPNPARATFVVNKSRGNGKVLFFLAMSGGGSRAAYLSGATMLRLQTLFDEVDLLREVDVMSSVSGGSLAAAYYAISRDEILRVTKAMEPLPQWSVHPALADRLHHDVASRTLKCSKPLGTDEAMQLRSLFPPESSGTAENIVALCAQAGLGRLRTWDEATVKGLMRRDYLWRWIGNWFWPNNLLFFDRGHIMAKTFEGNLFDAGLTSAYSALTFNDLNPARPYLIINATSATEQAPKDAVPNDFAFGSVFTFTADDFKDRLHSNIAQYSIGRAVMGSSAFPMVFPTMTLRDYRHSSKCPSDLPLCDDRYLHVFDGGNSDNLGLKSVKRTLLELATRERADQKDAGSRYELDKYDRIIVLLVDAFATPRGAPRSEPDPRSLFSRFLDTNLSDAVDSLLQLNRSNLSNEFYTATFYWAQECAAGTRTLPPGLCQALAGRQELRGELDLRDRLVFFHVGFHKLDKPGDEDLKVKVEGIPTSFNIGKEEADAIDVAVDRILSRDRCLVRIRDIVLGRNVEQEIAIRDCEGIDNSKKAKDTTAGTQ